MIRRSLAARLLAWFWLAGVLTFLLLGSIASWRDYARLRDAAHAQSSASIDASLKPLALAVWSMEYEQLPLYLRPLVQSGSLVRAEVRDATGKPIASLARPKVAPDEVDEQTQSLPLLAPGGEERIGELRVQHSLAPVRYELALSAMQSLAYEMVKLLLIGSGIYLLLDRLMLRRLRGLAAQLAALVPEDKTTRLSDAARGADRGDEIGVLAAAFNKLLDGRRALAEAEDRRLRAEADSRAKSEFVSRMSHELRTPLNAILGFAQALDADGVFADGHHRRNLQRLLRSGWHLSHLIGDVLDLSRIGSGSVKVTVGDVDLEQCWNESLDIVDHGAGAAEVSLHLSVDPDARIVMADPIRLRQVLVNLLTNAIKYNRPQGRVTLSARRRGPDVEIAVTDTGIGMSQKQLAHLFEPFNRLGRERSVTPGTGIGLIIAKGLIELMHGSLQVSSSEGSGTTVTFSLPCGQAGLPRPLPAPVEPARPDAVVLYVDDDPVNREIMRALLTKMPEIRMATAHTLHDGLQQAQQLHPTAMLLDMNLPDGSGLDLLRQLRAQAWARHLPVAIVSADTQGEAVSQALREGASAYIAKPLDFRSALDQIRELVWLSVPATDASPAVGKEA